MQGHFGAHFAKSNNVMEMLRFCKYHTNDLEAMHSYITYNSVTKGQARNKGHLSAQFVKIYIKRVFL